MTYRPIDHTVDGFRNAANYIDDVPADSVVVVDNAGSTECTTWGGLLTSVALRRGIAGTVIHGSARDIREIREQGYPLFTTAVRMVSGKNRVELATTGEEMLIGEVRVRAGDVVVADDNGAIAIPVELVEDVIARAEKVERTEELIAQAASGGIRLDEARRQFRYDTPWDGGGRTHHMSGTNFQLADRMIDLHYHAGPDITRRRHSVVQAGREYRGESGWVVIKSHLDSTAAAAWEARQEGLPVSGSVVLNEARRGLDRRVIQRAVFAHGDDSPARLIAYLPTLTPHPHESKLPASPFHPRFRRQDWSNAAITDDAGHVRPEVWDVLRCARDLDVVVATGHCRREESLAIIDAAADVGLDRLLLTHATHPISGFSEADIQSLSTADHVWVEITALTVLAWPSQPGASCQFDCFPPARRAVIGPRPTDSARRSGCVGID